jgi:hypothetical protein
LVNVTADTNHIYAIFGGAYARTEYYWTIEQTGGAPYNATVPIDVHVSGGVDSSRFLQAGPSNLYAEVYMPLPGTPGSYMVNACTVGPCTVGRLTFEQSATGEATVGEIYRVVLTASGSGSASYVGATFTLQAWVDPRIEISPSFDRRNDFQLVFSNGVNAIPEPASAWLAAFGLIGVLGWIRRCQAAPPVRR